MLLEENTTFPRSPVMNEERLLPPTPPETHR